jgi:tRNA uridine 5-carboxymethylaminomethyl modification enzyme
MLEQTSNVDFWQDMVNELLIEGNRVAGVKTGLGTTVRAKTVVLTNGTFLNGLIHIGEKNFGGGRAGEKAAKGITEQLVSLGFESGRMKTGTPPRVDGRSLNYEAMEEQKGDAKPGKFSFAATSALKEQRSCYITYTNPEVHDLLREGFDRSPMYNGAIKSSGPRYCPSIEDKIERFAERDRHQIFVEPEGWNTVEIYVNGFSTSLPEEVQYEAMRKMKGFENVKMFRPGYAIEYDYFPPLQLQHTLETKAIEGLYFAGQINGTTGYEEAACQGLMAGINAHLQVKNKEPFVLKRDEAYIGVLIDDLITKGTKEPYRMFTSRAEFRILLRQDNADLRLTPLSHEMGLADEKRMRNVEEKLKNTEEVIKTMSEWQVLPEVLNPYLETVKSTPIQQKMKARTLVSRPQVNLVELVNTMPELSAKLDGMGEDVMEQAEVLLKYEGYIAKEKELAEKMERLEDLKLPEKINYMELKALSAESREKLEQVRPKNIGQAARISGVSPADISVLMVHMGR